MKLIVKGFITLAVLVLLDIIISAFEPSMSSQVAVNQLNDSYDSNAMMTIYENVKSYFWILYPLIVGLVFRKDIKGLFKKKEEGQETSDK